MVPVGGVDNVFVLQFRIASFEFAYDVVRFELANLLLDLDTSFGVQRDRPKIFGDGSFLEGLEILPAICDYFFATSGVIQERAETASMFLLGLSSSKFSLPQLDLTTCHG